MLVNGLCDSYDDVAVDGYDRKMGDDAAIARTLRVDSLFCLLAGMALTVGALPVSGVVELPPWILVVVGLVSLAWGALLSRMRGTVANAGTLMGVMAVNTVVGLLLATFSLTANRGRFFVFGLLAVAVLGFAARQAWLLFRLR